MTNGGLGDKTKNMLDTTTASKTMNSGLADKTRSMLDTTTAGKMMTSRAW
jgi:hypothetical protein